MKLDKFILSIICVLIGYPYHAAFLYGIELSGYTRSYIGVLADEDNEYSMQQNTFDLKVEHTATNVAFKVNPYLYSYADRENVFDLRQSFIDIYIGATDIRAGKQQIVWGKADGVFITDIVSPKDLTDFILPDFEEIRIGVNALKAVTYFGNSAIEVVWIPTFTPTKYPDEGSIWYIKQDLPLEYEVDLSKKEVKNKISNSELFLKFSLLSSTLDVELIAGYFWDDNPTNHIVQFIDQATNQPKLRIIPEHHRLSMGGGSFSSNLGPLVIRGESAYYSGKYFQSADPALKDRVIQKDYIHYLIGFDTSLAGTDISLQLIQEQIMDYEEDIIQDKEVNSSTLLVRRNFLRETLTLEIMGYYNFNFQDSLYRPKLSYDVVDNVRFQFGANIFSGDEGPYGQYDKNDNAFASLKYSF